MVKIEAKSLGELYDFFNMIPLSEVERAVKAQLATYAREDLECDHPEEKHYLWTVDIETLAEKIYIADSTVYADASRNIIFYEDVYPTTMGANDFCIMAWNHKDNAYNRENSIKIAKIILKSLQELVLGERKNE